jgi:hypothetical protein
VALRVDPRSWPGRPQPAGTVPPPEPPASAPREEERAVETPLDGPTERCAPAERAPTDPVLALGLEAARVLIGHNLSACGMRVDPRPDLVAGDELRLALHLGVQPQPVVVHARVLPDDGERDLALAFQDLGSSQRRELERTLSLLPMIEMPDSGEALGGLVVSEILSRDPMGAAG